MSNEPTSEPVAAVSTSSDVARRRLVGGFLGGVLVASGLEIADAKQGGNGRGRGRGKGKRKGKGRGNGKGKQKVQICHGSGKAFTLISVRATGNRLTVAGGSSSESASGRSGRRRAEVVG